MAELSGGPWRSNPTDNGSRLKRKNLFLYSFFWNKVISRSNLVTIFLFYVGYNTIEQNSTLRRPKNGDMAGTFGISRPSPAHNGGQVWVSSAWPSCMRSTVGVLCASQRGPLSYSMILLRKPHYQRIKGPPPSPGEFAGSFGVCACTVQYELGRGVSSASHSHFLGAVYSRVHFRVVAVVHTEGSVGTSKDSWKYATRLNSVKRGKGSG